jgi:hypothetical protein
MLVSKESPLRKVPYALNRKEALFIDSMRFTFEMIDVAYVRLLYILEQITVDDSFRDLHPMAEAFMEAWSIIDSIHRLRCLIEQAPGIKQKELPQRRIFLDKTKNVEDFRHTIQHLNNDISKLADQNESAWGILTWFAITELYKKDDGSGDSILVVKSGCNCLMISGSVVVGKPYTTTLPTEMTFKEKVNLITLKSAGRSLAISDLFEYVVSLKEALENYIERKYSELPDARSDIYIFGRIDFEKPEK